MQSDGADWRLPRLSSAEARAEWLAGIGTWVLDLPSGRMDGRPGVRQLLELPDDAPEPRLGDYFWAVHPQDRDALTRDWQGLLQHGREYRNEHRLVLADGRTKHMRAVACVEVGADGVAVRAHGITQDVSDLRRAALAVERERDRNRAILANLHEGYLLVQEGVIVAANAAVCALTGHCEDELLGAAVPGLLWPPDEQAALDELRAALTQGPVVELGVALLRKDGTRFHARVSVTALTDPDPETPRLWVVLLRDVTAQRAYEQLLLARSETDPLTGLLNSRAFREMLRASVAQAGADRALSLALFDVDHFKAVNDHYGHAVGDEVLVALAARLDAATGNAVLARVGGEEFALLLPSSTSSEARETVELGLQALRSNPLEHVGVVTASAGVAELVPGMTDDALYRLADARLYEAKSLGRDRCRS